MNELISKPNRCECGVEACEGTHQVTNPAPDPTAPIPAEAKLSPPASKYPIKGTTIEREEFATETRRMKRRALAAGKPIKWQEARALAYQSLLHKHYPRIK